MADRSMLDAVLSRGFDAVMHFASFSQAYNLGNGHGFSVQEVSDTAKRVTGRKVPVVNEPRRAGAPARLVADASLLRQQLGWQPTFADLNTIVAHAWA